MFRIVATTAITFLSITISAPSAAKLTPELQTKLDKAISLCKPLSTDETIVAAEKAYNSAPPSTMTNNAWKKLTPLSPDVMALIKSDIGIYLKAIKLDYITEMFLNGADGGKVAFLSKTTSWNHKGDGKHDFPMGGKTWIGAIAVDESSGVEQIQVSLPIVDGSDPIGSIVIGFGIAQLNE